jgi:dihydrofolate synthase / folylpolyglutamate synthase
MIPKLDEYKALVGIESERVIKPGLASMEKALELLGHPEKHVQFVHVAGTNGKGSTVSFLEQLAIKHHVNVGKFMSPAVLDIHDQIQLNGQPITKAQLIDIFQTMKEAGLNGLLTDFELLTCAAFLHFANEQVDIALLEVGLGGTEDATNVIEPLVAIIPSIALEHTAFLGDTLEEIATHKAGIIKRQRPIIIGKLPCEAHQVMVTTAAALHAPFYCYGLQFETMDYGQFETYVFHEKGIELRGLSRQLLGEHQAINMALALTAFTLVAEHLQIVLKEAACIEAINETTVPGRFEQVLPNIYFDGAHNPASVKALVDVLQQKFSDKKIHFVVGMLADKDVEQAIRMIEPMATKISFIDIPNERALSAEAFFALSQHSNKAILKDVVPFLLKGTVEDEMIVVTGSLYLLAHIRAQLLAMI